MPLTCGLRVAEILGGQGGSGGPGQHVDPAAHSRGDAAQLLFQATEAAQRVGVSVGPVGLSLLLGLLHRPAGPVFGITQKGRGPLLGLHQQFVLVQPLPVVVLGLGLGAASVGLGKVHDVVALGKHFVGRADFLRDGEAKLVNQFYRLGPVDQDVAAGSGSLAGVDECLQFVDYINNIYDNPLSRSLPFNDRISEFRI